MELAVLVVALVAIVIVVARLVEPLRVPAPLALLAVGVALSFVPWMPRVELSPELVLLGLLPPLLYAAALQTSLIDVRTYRAVIVSLSFGLVLFTAAGVALVVHALLPVPFAVAFALGAIVAPPDAVAATAVARRIGLPRRVTTILEGESLVNDATALVALRTALAAAGLGAQAVVHPSLGRVGLSFLWAVAGGIGIGVIVFVVVARVRRRLHASVMDTALSFIVPFAAYVPAERVAASGVLAVVTAGLLLAHRAPVLQSAASRLSERTNWAAITFVLEHAVFLLIGLQMKAILEQVTDSDLTAGRILAASAAVLLTCLLLRPVWILPMSMWSQRDLAHSDRIRSAAVASWAGMRGVVTLAAALSLPLVTPHRSALVMIALVATIGTLLLQGLTLPALARALDVRGPDAREDALQEAIVIQTAVAAGLGIISEHSPGDEDAVTLLRQQARTRVNRVWERLGVLRGDDTETPSEQYRRLRLAMLDAEREEVLRLRAVSSVDHQVLSAVLGQLDAEEAALDYFGTKVEAVRDATLRAPDQVAASCVHLRAEPESAVPATPEGCAQCLTLGWEWVHLRLCTRCGHVGCCDSSKGRHATVHFHDSGHPVMRSLEPGEAWRWCYVDEVLG